MSFKTKSLKPTKTINDISPAEEAFIGLAKADNLESNPAEVPTPTAQSTDLKEEVADADIGKHDLHAYVKRHEWPIHPIVMPSVAEGRDDLDKPFMLRLPETLWNSVERHCKALGVSKSEWVRHAMLKLMREEQEFFADIADKL